MEAIINWLTGLDGWLIYLVVGVLAMAEAAIFVGFVLPGETAVVVGGVLASQGRVEIGWLLALVVAAAVVGDTIGFEVGKVFGSRLLEMKALDKHQHRIEAARNLIRRRGPVAVFLGRFIAFFRAVMPALAGASRMPYPRFLAFNFAGGLVWGVGFTLVGFFAGSAYKKVEGMIGTGAAIAIAALAVAVIVVWVVRRRVKERRATESRPATREAKSPRY